jgi:hypothetical protein
MFLLFGDCIVLLRKARECNLSSRGLMAEVDNPSAATMMASVTAAAGGQKKIYELTFCGWHILGDTRFTMSDDGRNVAMVSLHDLRDPGTGRERTSPAPTIRHFILQTAYEGKALKFTEEITKARVEGRFSEAERETEKWCLRSIKLQAAEVTLHTAIFEEGIDTLVEGRKEPASIRIVIDHEKGTKGAPVGHYGVDIVANVTVMGGGLKYRLEVTGLNEKVFVDEVVLEHLLPTFTKRGTVPCPSINDPLLTLRSKRLTSNTIRRKQPSPGSLFYLIPFENSQGHPRYWSGREDKILPTTLTG